MWSWRSKGSKIFTFCAVSLLALTSIAAPQKAEKKEENHLGATVNLRVTLEGITSYKDYLELKTGLLQSEGVDKVTIDSEAPGLVILNVRYAGEPKSLIEKLAGFFAKKYKMKEKGGSEISISPSI